MCLTTYVPARLKFLVEYRNTPQKLARRRNSFSTVETPNRLMNYVTVEASYMVEHRTVPKKPPGPLAKFI